MERRSITVSRILIVEDEHAIADIVAFNLNREGYETLIAADGTTGLEKALGEEFDLILLDVMLPGLDGWEVLSALREKKTVPVIMLTAREEELDKIHGLELGADDYITKPFSMNELKARIRANLRRVDYAKVGEQAVTEGQRLVANHALMQISKDGRILELTAKEYALLLFLMEHRGSVFSREQLLEQVWEFEGFLGDTRVVDVMIRRLREKVEDDPGNPDFILTKRGAGYYMEA
ncbi:MAG: response regulator transcription factor [Clostridia bacterium]|nr:response regulator transcription factor [Clostridia bacterium]MBQ6059453.1 response regulator transcription factor [Clostridia bacterium]